MSTKRRFYSPIPKTIHSVVSMFLSQLIPRGYIAFLPTPHGESRLSREIGSTIYAVDWGIWGFTPSNMQPLELDGHRSLFPWLPCLCTNEKGETYYRASAVRNVLDAGSTSKVAYARLALLCAHQAEVCLGPPMLTRSRPMTSLLLERRPLLYSA